MKKYRIGMFAGVLLLLFGAGTYMKRKEAASVTIIGGADGPTSIFLAGSVGSGSICIGLGVGLIILFSILAVCKKRRR